jgi:hypothetical protein
LGLLLAVAAWLMQLSVFLTPIFASQISIGYGVCQQLAVIATTTDLTPRQHHAQHVGLPAISHITAMSDMHGMMNMPQHAAQSTAATSQRTSVKNASTHGTDHDSHHGSPRDSTHGSSHGQCHFCFLFGHSVSPSIVVIALSLAPVAFTVSALKLKLFETFFIAQNKTLYPQGRAPPSHIL